MKKTLAILVVVLAMVAVFVLTKNTTNAPSDDILETISETMPQETENVGTPTPESNSMENSATQKMQEMQVMSVAYGPSGFDPKSVTVKAGQTVAFVNEGESFMWVASSKHPVHADYPEKTDKDCLGSSFDQCVAVGMGESFSFTFTQKGSWGYHNHVAPNNWGTVVVE